MCLTRHDKIHGLDITFKCKNILEKYNIPKNSILRGELITRVDHEGYKTKRNYISGMVISENPFPDDVEFICYEYLELDKNNKLTNNMSY